MQQCSSLIWKLLSNELKALNEKQSIEKMNSEEQGETQHYEENRPRRISHFIAMLFLPIAFPLSLVAILTNDFVFAKIVNRKYLNVKYEKNECDSILIA